MNKEHGKIIFDALSNEEKKGCCVYFLCCKDAEKMKENGRLDYFYIYPSFDNPIVVCFCCFFNVMEVRVDGSYV